MSEANNEAKRIASNAILNLLRRGEARIAHEKQLKADLRMQKVTGSMQGSTAAANALAKKIRDEALWSTISRVTVFQNQLCSCCGETTRYIWAFMAKQTHLTDRSAIRMVTARYNDPESLHLPKEDVEYHHEVPVCALCYPVASEDTISRLAHAAGLADAEQLPLEI